jgi:hypothetical protein
LILLCGTLVYRLGRSHDFRACENSCLYDPASKSDFQPGTPNQDLQLVTAAPGDVADAKTRRRLIDPGQTARRLIGPTKVTDQPESCAEATAMKTGPRPRCRSHTRKSARSSGEDDGPQGFVAVHISGRPANLKLPAPDFSKPGPFAVWLTALPGFEIPNGTPPEAVIVDFMVINGPDQPTEHYAINGHGIRLLPEPVSEAEREAELVLRHSLSNARS